MTKCTFCGRDYEIPYGLTEFDITGHTRHYCSSKCRKNFKMGRDNENIKWTAAFQNKNKTVISKDISKHSIERTTEKVVEKK